MHPPAALHSVPVSASTDGVGTATVNVSYRCPADQPQSYVTAYIETSATFNQSANTPIDCDGAEHTIAVTINWTFPVGGAKVSASLWSLSATGTAFNTFSKVTTSSTDMKLSPA
jgi:hypothetical protein